MSRARPYRLGVRAEQQERTRRRIVEAAVELHATLGPAATSLSAVARRAGVQRHTLYAHFPDEATLFIACSSHWRDLHPFPDPAAWSTIADPTRRLRRALGDVYAWYAGVEDAFALFVRDGHLYPAVREARQASLAEVTAGLARGFPRRKAVRATIGHSLAFETWRSLCRTQGLSETSAVALMVDLVGVTATRRG